MEDKKFNYIEFKIDIINNELIFLEKYLSTESDRIMLNDIKLIKSTITKLQSILIKSEEGKREREKEKNEKEKNENEKNNKQESKTIKLTIDTHEDILKYNTDLINKVSQINYII